MSSEGHHLHVDAVVEPPLPADSAVAPDQERAALPMRAQGGIDLRRCSPDQLRSLQAGVSNLALARMARAPQRVLARARVAMVQPGYATGDQFAIAAAMMQKTDLHVFITRQHAHIANRDPRGKADDIRRFYVESGIPPARIHIVDVDDLNANVNVKVAGLMGHGYHPGNVRRVNYATGFIASSFSAAMRHQVRTGWRVDASRDPAIRTWLGAKAINPPAHPAAQRSLRGRALVIWSRFSGKKGEIHIEHDTSYTGVRQIIDRAKNTYDLIVIAGDRSWGASHAGKYDQIVAAANHGLAAPKVFNLTEFWRLPAHAPAAQVQALANWGGNTRTGQFKLYDFLDRHYNLKHIGFRSGNLEAMALLGHSVRYLEERNSSSGARMAHWAGVGANKTYTQSGGLATGYERLLVDKPPTATGKHWKWLETEGGGAPPRPGWAPGLAVEAKPHDIRDPRYAAHYVKGFTAGDMTAIGGYLDS